MINFSDLEKVVNISQRSSSRLYISINAKKTIRFSTAFVKTAKIRDRKYAILFYSKKENALVFDFTDDSSEEGTVRLVFNNVTDHHVPISALSFFNLYQIEGENLKGRHDATLEEIPGLGQRWVVYLDKKERKTTC